MRILVLCDDQWHPASIPREGLSPLHGSEFTFDWIEDARNWSPEVMTAYPLVILTKSNNVSSGDRTGWMTDSVQEVFRDYVRQGNGLLAIHSGTAEYEQMPVLRSLLGGVFARHPEQCLVTINPVSGHPLANRCEPFSIKDEHYFMTMYDPDADIFVLTQSEHGEQPGGWRRTEGSGRVAALTPGHNLEVWLHPVFQTLITNSLRWCARRIG